MEIPIRNIFYLLSYAWNKLDEAEQLEISADDYKDAFGGSVRMAPSVVGGGGSVVMGNSMTSPMSASSPMNMNGSAMFAPQQHFQQQQSYNGYSGNVTASNPFASPNNQQQNHQPKTSMFDPLKNDPFA